MSLFLVFSTSTGLLELVVVTGHDAMPIVVALAQWQGGCHLGWYRNCSRPPHLDIQSFFQQNIMAVHHFSLFVPPYHFLNQTLPPFVLSLLTSRYVVDAP
jgi:hypothetical protein